jgi:hypothetical protein
MQQQYYFICVFYYSLLHPAVAFDSGTQYVASVYVHTDCPPELKLRIVARKTIFSNFLYIIQHIMDAMPKEIKYM